MSLGKKSLSRPSFNQEEGGVSASSTFVHTFGKKFLSIFNALHKPKVDQTTRPRLQLGDQRPFMERGACGKIGITLPSIVATIDS